MGGGGGGGGGWKMNTTVRVKLLYLSLLNTACNVVDWRLGMRPARLWNGDWERNEASLE